MNPNELDFMDTPAGEISLTATVANVQPRITSTSYRIAIIGEAPGSDEIHQGKPFVGFSGRELDRFLSRFGILRDACFIGNVCQHQPQANKIANFDWDGPQISAGIARLKEDLAKFKPNIILLLGGTALHAFKEPNIVPRKGKDQNGIKFVFPHSIGDWRGSFFKSHPDSPCPNTKCIASYHPAACLRQYSWTPLLMMDIQRCMAEATSPELVLPERRLLVDLTFERTVEELDKVIQDKPPVGTDIEGYWDNISCISFATSPLYAFIVPFTTIDGKDYWTVEQEVVLVRKVAQIISDPGIVKIWQNGLYDRFCLQYGYRIVARGRNDDIMLKHWELYCELEKSLSVQTSIYTKEPYYKQDRKTNDQRTYWQYCCRDSCVTYEIFFKLDKYLAPSSKRHYEFNLTLLNPLLYMELRGIKYNVAAAKQRLDEVNQHIYELQYELDKISGFGVKTTDKPVLRAMLRQHMCHKNDPTKPKKDYSEGTFDHDMRILLGEGDLSKAQLGKLGVDLDCSLNVKGGDFKTYIYATLGLPKQYDPKTKSLTTDYEALITLYKKTSHPALRLAIDIGELRTRSQMLTIATDPDGRIRSSYNEVGSETGRVTSSTSPTGSGYNLQTIPDENELKPKAHPLHRGMRDLLSADDLSYLAKCDLKGADGWTVGANLAALGDSTMLDDLLFGLKPAQILCYAVRHGVESIRGKTRPELAELCKEVKKSDWDYFAFKQCIWGYCYLMGVDKAVAHVFNVSEGTVLMKKEDMQKAKDMLFQRYNIQLWHKAMEKRLWNQPYPPILESPSGHIRKFFGRKAEIIGEALSHEPQSVTTYATNMAVFNCWMDPENREGNKLRIEPMHQVHDEFLSQWRQDLVEWSKKKTKEWFNNPIRIAGVEVVIPYDGAYGTDWAMAESKVGSI